MRAMVPHIIGIFFGLLWGVIAAQALPLRFRSIGIAFVVVLGILFLLRMIKRTRPDGATQLLFRKWAYLVAVGAEVGAIYLASRLSSRFGGENYFVSSVGVIVGLHFLGLWKATGSVRFVEICVAMCVVSGLSMLLPFAWDGVNLLFISGGGECAGSLGWGQWGWVKRVCWWWMGMGTWRQVSVRWRC